MILVTPAQTFENVDRHWEPTFYKPSYGPETQKTSSNQPWWKDYSCSFVVTNNCTIHTKQYEHEIHLKSNTTAVTEYF